MSIRGSATDLLRRLKSLFPRRWTSDTAPVRDAVFGGIGDSLAWLYAQQQTVKAGTRRAGTIGYLLDIDAWGFFQGRILRRAGEADAAWRKRYTDEIFRPRATRAAIDKAVYDLTGKHPIIVDPWNPNDTAAYRYSYYGQAKYGSLGLPYQFFVTAYRPCPPGIPNIAGYRSGYYGAPTTSYISLSQITSPVPDSEIYATIARTAAAGVVSWTRIQ
ncbi:hypothetical protein MKK88_01070 [Methylobacterium sp. E-005]|uniref:hypothetical protein n=1 Tax=Methylobacterium sp. E-005 TaxID=2836549 RepID=UPI001FB9A441|nr:hypothetical protein [Methylobacterium sp. E-005]MCJ2084587.1 hypothetical protein [Methylobacterium sp. E-005]